MVYTREAHLERLAERVRVLERESEALETEELTTAEDIDERPDYVIEFLLDMIDGLRA